MQLHTVGVERDALRRPLHARGLAHLVRFDSTVDEVIAELPLPVISRAGSHPDEDDPDSVYDLGQDHARPVGPSGEHGPRLRSVHATGPAPDHHSKTASANCSPPDLIG
ncbi:MAG: hypothetical protein WAN20_24495 [Pseudonocardiaceae bacterium]|jgi:hypothetical protein|nr:hypothetical protein [Pseudonocardiaceae bacterium]